MDMQCITLNLVFIFIHQWYYSSYKVSFACWSSSLLLHMLHTFSSYYPPLRKTHWPSDLLISRINTGNSLCEKAHRFSSRLLGLIAGGCLLYLLKSMESCYYGMGLLILNLKSKRLGQSETITCIHTWHLVYGSKLLVKYVLPVLFNCVFWKGRKFISQDWDLIHCFVWREHLRWDGFSTPASIHAYLPTTCTIGMQMINIGQSW